MDPDWRPRLRGAVLAFHDGPSVRFVDLGALTVCLLYTSDAADEL